MYEGPYPVLTRVTKTIYEIQKDARKDLVHVEKLKQKHEFVEPENTTQTSTTDVNQINTIQETRRQHERQRKVLWNPWLTMMMIMITTVFMNAAQARLHTTDPIIWRKTMHVIAKRESYNTLSLLINNPCASLSHSIYDERDRNLCEKAFWRAVPNVIRQYCEEVNHVEINRRTKRQAFLVPVAIATIVGTVSAGITSVVQNIFRGSEIATLEAKTNQAIDNIKDDLKFKMKFQETVMKTLRQLANQTADMEKEVKREHAARIINMLTNRLNTVELAMHRFLGQGKMRIVTEDFTFLFPNISIAAGSNIPYWEFESCQYQPHEDGRPVLILKIIAPEIATQMRVLEADPFVIFKEKGDQVCRYHYHGQHYLIYNVHRSCIHNLDIHPTGFRYQAFQVYKPDECSENSKLIHLWREQECERKIRNRPRELEEVQVKRDQQFTYVYCYNQTIAIGKESQKCENVVYRIPIEQAFSVNDEHFPGRENSHQILEATISYYHTEAINAGLFPSTTEYNKNFRKLEALLEQEKETLNKVTGGMIFVNQGNWVIIGIVLTLALALVIVGIYVGWKWTKRDRKNNDESQVHPIKLNTLKEEQIDVGHFYSKSPYTP